MAVQIERPGKGIEGALGQAGGVPGVLQVGHDDGELVAAQPRHRVAGARAGIQARRRLLEQQVAERVAQGVVDQLEPIQVDEQKAQFCARAIRIGQGLAQAVEEQEPVGQPGEGIVVGLVVDALLILLVPGDVPAHGDVPLDLAAVPGNGRNGQDFGVVVAGLAFAPHLSLPRTMRLQDLQHRGVPAALLLQGGVEGRALAHDIDQGVAGDGRERRVDGGHPEPRIHDDHGLAHGVHHLGGHLQHLGAARRRARRARPGGPFQSQNSHHGSRVSTSRPAGRARPAAAHGFFPCVIPSPCDAMGTPEVAGKAGLNYSILRGIP